MKQTRREFLKHISYAFAGSGMLSMTGCTGIPTYGHKNTQPNIVFVLADDLGYGDLGCFGQSKIRTPNLDRMAAEGMRLTNHYAGATVCAPSRCSLLTGKHTGHCTVRGNVDVLIDKNEETIPKVLKRAGYRTACIGKWGVGHPPAPSDPHTNGFDYFFGYLSMWHAHNFYPEFLWRNGQQVKLRNVVTKPDTFYKEGQCELVGLANRKVDYAPDLFIEDALDFINQSASPFFLFFTTTIPHANNEAPALGEHGMEVQDYGIYKNEDWPDVEKGKGAMITRLDQDMGLILDALRKRGISENTLVIFTDDNGPHKEGGVDPEFFNSSGPLRGIKRDLYEGGIRVPTIAWWPGTIKAGTVNDHISAFWDYLPTFAELTGKNIPKDIDGISMLPTLLGETSKQKQHEYLYWEFHEGGSKQAVRVGKWKAVRLLPISQTELYDLSVDIGETRNLARQHPDMVQKAEHLFVTAREDEETWPLQMLGGTMPF